MPLVTVYTRPDDGGVSVVHPVPPTDDLAAVLLELDRVVPPGAAAASAKIIDRAALPAPRTAAARASWRLAGGVVREDDAALAAWLTARTDGLRGAAAALLDDARAEMKALRGLLNMATDEINLLRQRLRAQDAAVAGAGTLAALKTAWAALAAVPDRTYAGALAAAKARVNDGSAD